MVPVWLTVLIAFIAPAFALGGVVVGAWMQRRTTREQLVAQREKDRETWLREDRHRFVAEKRELYGDLLSMFASQQRKLRDLVSKVEDEMFCQGEVWGAGKDSFGRSVAHVKALEIVDAYSRVREIVVDRSALEGRIELLAPQKVREACGELFRELDRLAELVVSEKLNLKESVAPPYSVAEALQVIRADLGILED